MKKIIILAGLALLSLSAFSAPSYADWGRDDHRSGHRWNPHHTRYYERPRFRHHEDRVVVYGNDWTVRVTERSTRPHYYVPARPVAIFPSYPVMETHVVTPVAYQVPPLLAAPSSSTFVDTLGRTCREYQSTITVDGRPQPAYGTACLGQDGAWSVAD